MADQPVLSLRIPMRATSMNKWMRMHWRTQRRHRDDVAAVVRGALPWQVIQRFENRYPVQKPVRVHIAAYMRPPLLDADNIVAKDLIDALKGWVIRDDDKRFVDDVTVTVKKNPVDAIVIDIYEVSPGT